MKKDLTKFRDFLRKRLSEGSAATYIRAVEGALTRVVARASLVGGKLDPSMVHEVLGPIQTAGELRGLEENRAVTVTEIKTLVSELFLVPRDELNSSCRTAKISRARQVAMSLTREFTKMSLPAIADAFGRRDHTTVLHAIKTIETKTKEDPELARMLAEARTRLAGK